MVFSCVLLFDGCTLEFGLTNARQARRKDVAANAICTQASPDTVDAEYRRSDGARDVTVPVGNSKCTEVGHRKTADANIRRAPPSWKTRKALSNVKANITI
uniref:SFRICE_016936 n=1 Tax=Spodoptera frugiperda TaxID=7108 RepID=A0A2H1VZV3_SPOFR